jgi:hypothetical protein
MTEKICPECNGEGVVDQGTEDESRCPTCNGSGIVPMPSRSPKRCGIRSPDATTCEGRVRTTDLLIRFQATTRRNAALRPLSALRRQAAVSTSRIEIRSTRWPSAGSNSQRTSSAHEFVRMASRLMALAPLRLPLLLADLPASHSLACCRASSAGRAQQGQAAAVAWLSHGRRFVAMPPDHGSPRADRATPNLRPKTEGHAAENKQH